MKNKNFLLPALLLLNSIGLSAQNDDKGAAPRPAPSTVRLLPSTVRAVVVGISDYQDPGISDLRFADRDAEAFVQWLRSPAGGSLPDDNIQLLLNADATRAQFAAKLDWLIEQCREGDQAIIYFSGHGDVDSKMFGQEGFLLCWDTPAQSYMAGAYGLYYLKIVVSTLSINNKAKVLVIADACHAGKLGGSSIGGAQYTNANLAQQFAGEVKILSCQPNEFSIEGEQWGGGRGAFSYHLVDGLYGLADQDDDDRVTVKEMNRYLEDRVPEETMPADQNPMVIGDKETRLAKVDPDMLARWRQNRTKEPILFKPIENRGLEDEVLASVDSSIRQLYYAFKKMVKDKAFFEPQDSCADAYYEQLAQVPELQPLYGWMRRNYAAALQDEAQQYMNQWMNSKISIEFNYIQLRMGNFPDYPRCMARSAELLGEAHYLYKDLKSKEYHFRTRAMFSQYKFIGGYKPWDPIVRDSIFNYIQAGLAYDNHAAYHYLNQGRYFRSGLKDYENAVASGNKAIEISPNWLFAYRFLGFTHFELGHPEAAVPVFLKAIQIDPANFACHPKLIEAYCTLGEYEKAMEITDKAMAVAKDIVEKGLWSSPIFDQLENIDAGYLYSHAEEKIKIHTELIDDIRGKPIKWQALERDSLSIFLDLAHKNLVDGNKEEAARLLDKAEQRLAGSEEEQFFYFFYLGIENFCLGRFQNSERLLRQNLAVDSMVPWISPRAYLLLAFLAEKKNDLPTAAALVNKSIDLHLTTGSYSLYTMVADLIFYAILDHHYNESIFAFQTLIDRFPNDASLPYHLGRIYAEQMNDPVQAIQNYQKCIAINPAFKFAHYYLAVAQLRQSNTVAALDALEQCLQAGYDNREKLETDPDLDGLRDTERYRGLLVRFFPEKGKD